MEIVGYEVYEAGKRRSDSEARDFSHVRFTDYATNIKPTFTILEDTDNETESK